MLDGSEDAGEISLAENIERLAMHPADQFDAFKAQADTGKGPEEIAVRFGISPAVVRRRLKLAAVSPRLLEVYRADEMDLDQLMAFAVSDDHAPSTALAAVVTHAMALTVFYGDSYGTGSCLDLRIHTPDLRSSAEGIAASPAAQALDERRAAWTRRLPQEADGLWDWLMTQTPGTLTDLMACCAAFTLTAVHKPQDRSDAPHLLHADQLAKELRLDMTQWWQPTAASYFGRISKARILEAVTEACSKGAADNLAKLKKDALATRAEGKLAGTGWLPAVLRSTALDDAAIATAEIAEAA